MSDNAGGGAPLSVGTVDRIPDAFRVVDEIEPGEQKYLLDDRFVDELLKLAPTWQTNREWLLQFFRRMDERGDLRPVLRFRLGESYAHHEGQRAGNPPLVALSGEDREHFETVRHALTINRRWFEDPARAHPLEVLPLLEAYREPGTGNIGTWEDYRVVVRVMGPQSSYNVYRYHLRSAYASWQLFRAWTLLERFTFRALLDPTKVDPPDLYGPDWADDFGRRVRVHSRGNPRADRLVELLEAGGWLSALARARALVDWAEHRTHAPASFRWAEGEAMSIDDRWQIERARVEARCATLVAPWAAPLQAGEADPAADGDLPELAARVVPVRFANRVRRLLELWRWATDEQHGAFAAALHRELHAAAEWAIFAFRTDFVTVDRDVGVLDDHEHTCLAQALQPNRHEARQTIRDLIEEERGTFNVMMIAGVALVDGDADRFLDHLDANELWVWQLELSRWARSGQRPSDTMRDETFLHLRSTALLFEPLLGSLADAYGTPADRAKIGTGTAKDPLKMFIQGRGGWRDSLWQQLTAHYELTTTRGVPVADTTGAVPDPSTLLTQRINQIDALTLPVAVSGAAKEILVITAVRNFGAHRFSRDAELIERYGGRIARAVLFTALFYWKVATTLR